MIKYIRIKNFYVKIHRGVAQLGRALASGLNHRFRRRFFEKSRKPLKTLTFSALPNVEKSSISRFDHMFDHLRKNSIFLPFRGVAKVVSRIVRDSITVLGVEFSRRAENPWKHWLFRLSRMSKNHQFLGLTTCLTTYKKIQYFYHFEV